MSDGKTGGDIRDKQPAARLKDADIPSAPVGIRTPADAAASAKFDDRVREAQVSSEELQIEILQEQLNKLKQQQNQRRTFFSWAMFCISAVLIASGAFMTAYMIVKGNQTEPAVIIAWLSSGLVETLGLGYIIANYLFEQDGNTSKKEQRKKRGGNSRN